MGDLRTEVARLVSGHIGPNFDDLAKNKAQLREWNRAGYFDSDNTQDDLLVLADAAIAVVLERAAQVAEGIDDPDPECVSDRIAAAIRSLAKEQQP